MVTGKVYLVGAGPGDPGLLTLKAHSLLRSADAVLYDYLVHPSILQLAHDGAELICVGKAKGQHSMKQDDINALMLKHALAGQRVVRLKGGDPCVFGRLGEELLCLKDAKVPYEIVPGISSTTAVPAYAGIPVTHRDLARSFAVVTGTLRTGDGEANLTIPNADTLVFVMAVTHLEAIVKRLVEDLGRSPETPAALIYRGSTAAQKRVVGTLETIVSRRDEAGLTPPAILVVGEVAALGETYDWWSGLPLAGERVIVLRTMAQGGELAERLREMGAEVVQLPMIAIAPVVESRNLVTTAMLADVTSVIFTSPNGVTQMVAALLEQDLDVRALVGKRIIAIGPKTAAVLAENGLRAEVVASRSYQEGIVQELATDLSDEVFLIPTSVQARASLRYQLQERGASVKQIGLYNTVMPPLPDSDFQLEDGDRVVFTSSSTVRHFFASGLFKGQAIVAHSLGPVTTRTLQEMFDGQIVEAESASVQALVHSLAK